MRILAWVVLVLRQHLLIDLLKLGVFAVLDVEVVAVHPRTYRLVCPLEYLAGGSLLVTQPAVVHLDVAFLGVVIVSVVAVLLVHHLPVHVVLALG